jgi:hypothetical protein
MKNTNRLKRMTLREKRFKQKFQKFTLDEFNQYNQGLSGKARIKKIMEAKP